MTTKSSRKEFRKLAGLCDEMERAIEAGDVETAFDAWDETNGLTSSTKLSDYEDAITYAFDEFDSYMHQHEYMAEHRDEWGYDRWHLENVQREKYAHATCAQQDLIRLIYGVDEETVHDDLVLWRRYIDLFHTVAGLRVRHAS